MIEAGSIDQAEALDCIAAALRVQLDGPPAGSSWANGPDSGPAQRVGWDGVTDFVTQAFDPLEQELLAASLTPAAAASLEAIGVPRGVIGRYLTDLGLVQMTISGDGGRWEPHGPDRRLVLAVRERTALIDLVALASGARDEWALRTGDGAMLGSDLFWSCQCGARQVLRIFDTPFAWLIGGGDGICVLEWNEQVLAQLRSLGPRTVLQVEPAAKARLQGLLAWGGLPRVEAVAHGVRAVTRRAAQH